MSAYQHFDARFRSRRPIRREGAGERTRPMHSDRNRGPLVVPFPSGDGQTADTPAILIAKFLADQVAREVIAQERALQMPAAG